MSTTGHDPRQAPSSATPPGASWGQVTVPVDPGAEVVRALEVGTVVARQAGMGLELVTVHTPGIPADATDAYLAKRVQEAEDFGAVRVRPRRLEGGDISDALLRHVAEGETTMLCMDTHARGAVAEMALGSVSERIVRRSPVPVLLVGPHVKARPEGYRTVLVAVDGSPQAEAAVDAAAALAARLAADIFLVNVIDPNDLHLPADIYETSYLRRVASRLPASKTNYDVLHGTHPAKAILDFARSERDAILVTGTHGRTGLRRLALGSVALDVVRGAHNPVLVVSSASTHVAMPRSHQAQHV